jgi:hypothetical protein
VLIDQANNGFDNMPRHQVHADCHAGRRGIGARCGDNPARSDGWPRFFLRRSRRCSPETAAAPRRRSYAIRRRCRATASPIANALRAPGEPSLATRMRLNMSVSLRRRDRLDGTPRWVKPHNPANRATCKILLFGKLSLAFRADGNEHPLRMTLAETPANSKKRPVSFSRPMPTIGPRRRFASV